MYITAEKLVQIMQINKRNGESAWSSVFGFQHKLPSLFPELLLAQLQNTFFLSLSSEVLSGMRELLSDGEKAKSGAFTSWFLFLALSPPKGCCEVGIK